MHRRSLLNQLAAIFALLLFAACSKDSDDADVFSDSDSPLSYVAADTPYLFASLEPLPDAYYEKIEPRMDRLLQSYQEVMRLSLREGLENDGSGGQMPAEERRRIVAVFDRILGLFSSAGLRDAGIDRDSKIVLYGMGLLPVLRVTLSDVDAFEETLSGVVAEAAGDLQSAQLGELTYRYAGNDDVRFVLAVNDAQLVASIVPANLSDQSLQEIFGLKRPAQPITTTGRLQEIANAYGLSGSGAGFVDLEKIVSTFIDEQSGINAELLALSKMDREPLSDVCKAEIRSMASIAPRLVTGYTEVNTERMASRTVLELRKDIADGLATLPAIVPGLGSDHGGLFSFGMSIDLLAAREFYAARLDAMEEAPYRCELFAELQENAAKGRATLEQPVPPIVYGVKGFLAVIDNIEGVDVATKKPPTEIDMRFLLATDNAPGLLAMGSMFSPELAMLNLQADGKPKRFESPLLQAPVEEAWVAMQDNALAVAVGNGAEAKAGSMLSKPGGSPPPMLSMHMDAARYYSFIGDAMSLQSDDEPSPELNEALQGLMQNLAALIDRVSMAVNFTDRGIEIPAVTTLKE